ncbi:MAG: family NAD(P)-dependent oxidoreductase [Candidatus Peribacteria bacterium]|nr:family NAD(P)-dependent oxidoreductase [Candidatus Peribacteria bacterium]
MTIADSIILITGASHGIGKAAAQALTHKGAKVALVARSKDTLEELSKELPDSLVIAADMTRQEDRERMIQETMDHYGRIDILINNAGQGLYATIETTNLDEYRHLLELNVIAPLHNMQLVIPHMRAAGKGMIVNISSMVSKMHIPGLGAYASTKYALNALSHTARAELEKDNIIVSAVMPTRTATNFGKNSLGGGMAAQPALTMPNMPPADSVEKVAEKVVEAIETGQAETLLVQIPS